MTALRRIALACTFAFALPAAAQDAVGRVGAAMGTGANACSGTLVAPSLVLTAAHCVADTDSGMVAPPGAVFFVAGWDGAGHAGAARVRAITLHPEAFGADGFDVDHDLALLRLAGPVDLPVLPLGVSPAMGPFTLLGYGRSAPDALRRDADCAGTQDGALWRIGCPVETGHSGGPVVAGTGAAARVVAVIVATTGEATFAVPLDPWLRREVAANPTP